MTRRRAARLLYGVSDGRSASESFTPDERRRLAAYFTNLDEPVFAITNLPDVVKGALFARYSRSAKSLRRLFLDEFATDVPDAQTSAAAVGVERAERLYTRVFHEYGDDSVAQLGGAHIACEGVSNILTKVLERGRLASYLEQSTRYVPYTDRPQDRWKYLVPDELDGTPLRDQYVRTLDRAFEVYAGWIEPMQGLSPRAPPKGSRRFGWHLQGGDPGQGARYAARTAARRHAVERGHLRLGTGLRIPPAADARASAGRDAAVCRPHAGRTAEGDSRVS